MIYDNYSSFLRKKSAFDQWKMTLFVAIIANLPDMDVLLGLVFTGNGSAFHRGPTHSLIFAVFMGFLASNACGSSKAGVSCHYTPHPINYDLRNKSFPELVPLITI